jgi:hypothetical protein
VGRVGVSQESSSEGSTVGVCEVDGSEESWVRCFRFLEDEEDFLSPLNERGFIGIVGAGEWEGRTVV